MPYLTKEDLTTHLYAEIIDEIIRDQPALVDKAIAAAISEVKSYLSRYNLVALFGSSIMPAVVEDEHLKNIVKDIACWHLIRLANPNISMELFRTLYEDALKFLTLVMKGQADPAGWLYTADDAATAFVEGSGIQWSSNRKRTNHF